MKQYITFEISKAENGEFKVSLLHSNGNNLFKETYKNKTTLKKIVGNFIKKIQSDYYKVIIK